jgi:nickel transport protein
MVRTPLKTTSLSLIVAIAVLSVADLQAHGIWFQRRAGRLALIYGEGPDDGVIVSRLPHISNVIALDAAGAPVPIKLVPTDHLLLVDTPREAMVIAAVLDNGVWTTTAEGRELQKPKTEVPGAKDSGQYFRSGIHLRGDLKAPLGALPGQVLQLTPVTATLPKRMGDSLTLRALLNGKPLADAAVTVDWVNDFRGTPLRTGADGTVTLKVRNQGVNVISVVHQAPARNRTDTDIIEHRATLSFVLAP